MNKMPTHECQDSKSQLAYFINSYLYVRLTIEKYNVTDILI